MKILIIGAHGKIGKIISEKMSKSDSFQPTAFIRNKAQKEFFDALKMPSIVASLEGTVDQLAQAFEGMDAIVFTAGSGGKTGADKTLEIDLDGAVKSMIAAEKAKVKRYVMVSVARADLRSWWEQSPIKPYFIAKHFADNALKNSALDYTIVRPVRLTDEPGTGKATIMPTPDVLQKSVSREDVADVVISCLQNPETIKKVLEMSAGTTPVEVAIKNCISA
jgi:uncharacterized protein YbjT (DUF2867 family)